MGSLSLFQGNGMGSLSLSQGIFTTQGSNPGLLHRRQTLYQLSHKGSLATRHTHMHTPHTHTHKAVCFPVPLGAQRDGYVCPQADPGLDPAPHHSQAVRVFTGPSLSEPRPATSCFPWAPWNSWTTSTEAVSVCVAVGASRPTSGLPAGLLSFPFPSNPMSCHTYRVSTFSGLNINHCFHLLRKKNHHKALVRFDYSLGNIFLFT